MATDLFSYECPRCGSSTSAAFYGPCESCVRALREVFAIDRSEHRDREAAEYEPKMNVTPNAVALKDD